MHWDANLNFSFYTLFLIFYPICIGEEWPSDEDVSILTIHNRDPNRENRSQETNWPKESIGSTAYSPEIFSVKYTQVLSFW